MLDRIKKRQLDGFKEFVLNLETTPGPTRVQIFTAGILEDPIFMGWVMKNLRTFEDFLQLPSEDIDTVLMSQDQLMGLFAKCMFGAEPARIMDLEMTIPRLMSKFKDELSYLKEVTTQERESARSYLVKTARKLQMDEKIQGFAWKLPPQDVFYSRNMKDGPGKILFEDGSLAAEGEFAKGRRTGYWKHNYENGKLMAEGEYVDGLKKGQWVFYFSNGNIRAQGKYMGDHRHGIWKEWDRAGALSEVNYHLGKKEEK